MEASNLSISIPSDPCKKNCPYCISKISEQFPANQPAMLRKCHKVVHFAKLARIGSVLITGKDEPCDNYPMVRSVVSLFKDFPVELQTNGLWLSRHHEELSYLEAEGCGVIALSIDHMDDIDKLANVIHAAKSANMIVRLTINMTMHWTMNERLENWISRFAQIGVRQVLFRRLSYPKYSDKRNKVVSWIDTHTDDEVYYNLAKYVSEKYSIIRYLPHGAGVWDVCGISASFSDYCVQEVNNTKDIRSLIFQRDGFVYTSWSSKASILF